MPFPEIMDTVLGAGPAHGAERRPEIDESWRHCTAIGLRHDRFAPARDGDHAIVDPALLQAGRLVVERLGQDLHGSGVAAVLTDGRGCIIDRHADEMTGRLLDQLMLATGFIWGIDAVGTNALGLATHLRRAAKVHGPEHYMDALGGVTTVAAPVRDPRTGGLTGALGLVCAADVANDLLLPMARYCAREIEYGLVDGDPAGENVPDGAFPRRRRRTHGALVPFGEPNGQTTRTKRALRS